MLRRLWLQHNTWVAVSWFGALALALTWRAWTNGGVVFLLDMPWPDQFQLRDITHSVAADGTVHRTTSSGAPWMLLFAGLSHVVTAAVVQKLLLLGILFVAGISMWLLAGTVYRLVAMPSSATRVYRIVAGTIYVVNPYSIDRLWAGQWRVLAGYALAPLLGWMLVRYWQLPTRRRLLQLAGLYALLPTLSLHWWFMLTLLFAPVLVWAGVRQVRQGNVRTVLRRVGLAAGMFAVVNGWWLVQAFTPTAPYAQLQPADAQLFAATPTLPGGIVGSVLGLGGFWYHPYSFAGNTDWLWVLCAVGLMVLSGAGLWALLRRHRTTPVGWTLTAAIVWGFSLPLLGSTQAGQAVLQAIPGFVGLRESTKLVGLLALGYALLAPIGLGLAASTAGWRLRPHWLAAAMATAVLLLMSPAFAATPLQPHAYPPEWRQAQNALQQAGAVRVLVLPYTGYVRLPFAGNAYAASPVTAYFTPIMTTGTGTGNPQLDVSRGNGGALHDAAQQLLGGTDAAATLALYDIDHVMVYRPFGRDIPADTPGVNQVLANAEWAVYRVE